MKVTFTGDEMRSIITKHLLKIMPEVEGYDIKIEMFMDCTEIKISEVEDVR